MGSYEQTLARVRALSEHRLKRRPVCKLSTFWTEVIRRFRNENPATGGIQLNYKRYV